MFDSYLCKRFKEKRITIGMLQNYVLLLLPDKIIFILLCLIWLLIAFIVYAFYMGGGFIFAAIMLTLSVIGGGVAQFLSNHITVATCPLNKK